MKWLPETPQIVKYIQDHNDKSKSFVSDTLFDMI